MLSRLFVPDTFDYMVAGYVVLTVVISLYVSSIALRWKKSAAELRLYKEDK